jgi:N-sulfoglucosamine sulfohydrolase
MNVLIITADDLSYGAVGCEGCNLPDITPNIDAFAKESYHFHQAHTTVGLCQPSRSVLMTGLYPWNNGALGFGDVYQHVATLPEIMKFYGYKTGIIGKVSHLSPLRKFLWDYANIDDYVNQGKDPEVYKNLVNEFLQDKRPFFLLINSHDPHRPLPTFTIYDVDAIKVPPFLNNTKGTRSELAQYYTAVHRFDKTVGSVLSCVNKDDTLVIITTDHGMPFPFVKANCYVFSTRIPLLYRFPSKIITRDDMTHMVSGVDLMPTILELLDLDVRRFNHFDGKSYAGVLSGGSQTREFIYSCLTELYQHRPMSTRSIHTKELCYIRNFWVDEKKTFVEDGCLDGQTAYDHLTPKRKNFIRYRSPEEFYDLSNDYYALNNVMNDPKYIDNIKQMKHLMLREARRSNDVEYLKSIAPKKPEL